MQKIIYGVLMVRGKSYCSAKWIKWAFSFAFKTIINQDSIDAERSHPSSSLGLVIYAALSQDCFTLLCKHLGSGMGYSCAKRPIGLITGNASNNEKTPTTTYRSSLLPAH